MKKNEQKSTPLEERRFEDQMKNLDAAMSKIADGLEKWWTGLPWYKKAWHWIRGWRIN
jgi:hypothetical protein